MCVQSPVEAIARILARSAKKIHPTLLQSTRQAILGRANAKRTPSNVTAYKVGDRVRVINQKYLAEKLRGNLSKMSAR